MIDLQAVTAEARKELIALGQRFTSADVLKQGAQTLKHFYRSEGVLELFGYDNADAENLAQLCKMLEQEVHRRDSKVVGRRQLRAEARQAEQKGRDARALSRTVLENAKFQLRLRGRDEALGHVEAVLEQTTHANPTFELLSRHIVQLQGAFDECVVGMVSSAAVDHSMAKLKEASELMSKVHAQRPRRQGTPYSSEQIDFLDGLVIENVRAARRAAMQAAKALGKPHLRKAFMLNELYARSRSSNSAPSSAAQTMPEEVEAADDDESGEEFED